MIGTQELLQLLSKSFRPYTYLCTTSTKEQLSDKLIELLEKRAVPILNEGLFVLETSLKDNEFYSTEKREIHDLVEEIFNRDSLFQLSKKYHTKFKIADQLKKYIPMFLQTYKKRVFMDYYL